MDTLPCNLSSAFQIEEEALGIETSIFLSIEGNPWSLSGMTADSAFLDSEGSPENHTTSHLVFQYMRQCLGQQQQRTLFVLVYTCDTSSYSNTVLTLDQISSV